MNINEVRKIAKTMGINSAKKKKADLVREIQQAEQNIACFGTDRFHDCGELDCLWRTDCDPATGKPKKKAR